jgi:hypothetical protein
MAHPILSNGVFRDGYHARCAALHAATLLSPLLPPTPNLLRL